MNIFGNFFRAKKGDLATWRWNHIRALRVVVAAITGTFLVVGLVLFAIIKGQDDRPLQVISTPASFQDGHTTYTAIFRERKIPTRRYAEADSVAEAKIRERYFGNRPDAPTVKRVSEYKTRDIGTSIRIENAYADFEVPPQTKRP